MHVFISPLGLIHFVSGLLSKKKLILFLFVTETRSVSASLISKIVNLTIMKNINNSYIYSRKKWQWGSHVEYYERQLHDSSILCIFCLRVASTKTIQYSSPQITNMSVFTSGDYGRAKLNYLLKIEEAPNWWFRIKPKL